MTKFKVIGLISGIFAFLISIALIVCGFMEFALPKPVMIVFAVVCIANAVLVALNAKKGR